MSWPEHAHRARPGRIREGASPSIEEAGDDSTSAPESSADEEEGSMWAPPMTFGKECLEG
jgi:hypothetical protein